MTKSQIAAAREIAEQWPLLSEVSLIAMIANAINAPFELVQIWVENHS